MPIPCSKKDLESALSWTEDCEGSPARRVKDIDTIKKLDEVIEAINNIESGPGGGGGIECQELVIDLVANTWVTVPHTFTDAVCDVKTYDTLGNEIDVVSRKSGPLGTVLELCSTADISDVLVIVEGE